MIGMIVIANTVFVQSFPGHSGGGSSLIAGNSNNNSGNGGSNSNNNGGSGTTTTPPSTTKIITPNCNSLTGHGFPSMAPSAGAILFDCNSYGAIKVWAAGTATPTITPTGLAGGAPSPYITLSLNLHEDPPLLPCIPSTRIITSGSPVTFTSSDVGHSFDYCASFTTVTSTDFPSFTVTWNS
jgi:hypothetical protein